MLLCLAAVTLDRVLVPSLFTAAVKLFCFVPGFPVTAVVSYLDHAFWSLQGPHSQQFLLGWGSVPPAPAFTGQHV